MYDVDGNISSGVLQFNSKKIKLVTSDADVVAEPKINTVVLTSTNNTFGAFSRS